MCTRFEIDIDSYPIRISISKERKKLLTSGEVREYKRVRGYVELHELDALHSWIAIRKDQFEILEELLIDFVKSMNFEIKIEITPEKYPVLYKVLKEFEEKGNAWIYHQNLPEIGWIFLTLWVYRYERDIAKYLEEEGIKLSKEEIDKLEDDIDNIDYEITTKIDEATGIAISGIDHIGWNELQIEGERNRLYIERRCWLGIDKEDNKYIIEIMSENDSTWINKDKTNIYVTCK